MRGHGPIQERRGASGCCFRLEGQVCDGEAKADTGKPGLDSAVFDHRTGGFRFGPLETYACTSQPSAGLGAILTGPIN